MTPVIVVHVVHVVHVVWFMWCGSWGVVHVVRFMWCDAVRCGVVWRGVAWCGEWCGVMCGVMWCMGPCRWGGA